MKRYSAAVVVVCALLAFAGGVALADIVRDLMTTAMATLVTALLLMKGGK